MNKHWRIGAVLMAALVAAPQSGISTSAARTEVYSVAEYTVMSRLSGKYMTAAEVGTFAVFPGMFRAFLSGLHMICLQYPKTT